MQVLYKSFLFSLLLNALTINFAYSQEKEKISLRFNGASFQQVMAEIERKTGYQFYYDPAWTDSLKVMFNVVNQPLETALDSLLSGTDLHYNIYNKLIFITRERQVLTELPIGFFEGSASKSNLLQGHDFSEFERREKQKKQTEEKLYIIGQKSDNLTGTATVAGVIRDSKTGEPVVGASVFTEEPMIGVATDQFGFYSISLRKGRHDLKIKRIGMKSTYRTIMLYSNGKLEIEMEEDITPLKEVIVESERDVRVSGMQMGMEKLDIRTMKQIPLALGETDIMKVVLTLPGVQTVGEGTVGLNVRGGASNQNLILYNDATVYNPSHLFGFFSTFNPDVLKNVELYKSGISAEYGGRLSSVLDVHTREGNLKKFSGAGGISPVTARLSLEGPIIKARTAILVGARSTYSDWILRQLDSEDLQKSTASFYDFNLNVSHKFDDDNNLYLSGYLSKDKFRLNGDTLYSYGDRNASLKFKHTFSTKLFGVFTGSASRYDYEVKSDENPINAAQMNFSVQQGNAKAEFNYFPNTKHTLTGGAGIIRYDLSPGEYRPLGSESEVEPTTIQREQAMEASVYAGENYEINSRLAVYLGLRYSFYQALGPRETYTYAAGVPKETRTIQDTLYYTTGETVATYHGAEPRLSIRYSLPQNASIKLSYNRMRQYIQMLSNTAAIAPTDIWKLSDSYTKPQIGDQFSLGYYRYLRNNSIEASMEAYYKITRDATDFKDGAELLLNPHLETEILTASGKAYGAELLIKKSSGKLNGWISYTYSRSLLKVDGEFSSETINNGSYYPSSYDKPHAFNFIGNYKFNRRFNFSLNVTYSTGRPMTIPVAQYQLGGTVRTFYSDRNAFRIPDYFRTDVSFNIEGNHKIKKLAHSSWTIAVYNVTSRANAYSVFFVTENGEINGYKLSVFAEAIPTLTYNFKF